MSAYRVYWWIGVGLLALIGMIAVVKAGIFWGIVVWVLATLCNGAGICEGRAKEQL